MFLAWGRVGRVLEYLQRADDLPAGVLRAHYFIDVAVGDRFHLILISLIR